MIIDLFNRQIPDILHVRVTPRAASNRIKVEYQEDGKMLIRIYVTAVPEDSKANQAVIALLAKELRLPKESLTIIQGLKSRDKIILCKNL